MAEIELSQGMVAIVDDDDLGSLSKCKWYVNTTPGGNSYAQTRLLYKRFYMHRVVTDAPYGHHVHHVNGNTLDNRKANLAVLSPVEHRFEHNKSERSGAYFDKAVGKYRAAITLEGQRINLGLHLNKDDALDIVARARKILPGLPADERLSEANKICSRPSGAVTAL